MLFLTAFVVPIFLHFLRYYVKFLNFGTSFGTQLGPKWHHKSTKWVQKAKKSISRCNFLGIFQPICYEDLPRALSSITFD